MITMYPMDFEEFLWALGRRDLADMIGEHYLSNEMFSLHDTAMKYYRTYLLVGGMPRVVLDYIETNDYNFVTASQKSLNDSYIADMAKYATANETTKIMNAYNSIPAQLSKENRKFQYRVIKSGARAYEYETPIEWLNASGVINKCVKVKDGKMPLSIFVENESFKIYMADTGILCSKFSIPPKMVLTETNTFDNFKGALTENYIASALRTIGYDLYYWEANGKAEVDFVIQSSEGEVIPVEVKAADNVRAKSLGVFMKKYSIEKALRISSKNFGLENNIKSVPLYAVFAIDE